jgi:hypothetical protein
MTDKIKQAMSLLSFSPEELFANLSEGEKRDLLSGCSVIYTNPAFVKVCNESYTKEILETIANSHDIETLAEGRGKIMGASAVMELFKTYHLQYLESIKKEETLSNEDRQEII